MNRPFDLKSIVSIVIVAIGTRLLTDSWAIAAGVALLLYVLDSVLYTWAAKKNEQYYDKKEKENENGETH